MSLSSAALSELVVEEAVEEPVRGELLLRRLGEPFAERVGGAHEPDAVKALDRRNEVDLRARVAFALIDPGKPWQNATNESFNDKFRDECLSLEWFRCREEAKVLIEAWRVHDNEIRPHSSPGYLTPREFIDQSCNQPDGAILQ